MEAEVEELRRDPSPMTEARHHQDRRPLRRHHPRARLPADRHGPLRRRPVRSSCCSTAALRAAGVGVALRGDQGRACRRSRRDPRDRSRARQPVQPRQGDRADARSSSTTRSATPSRARSRTRSTSASTSRRRTASVYIGFATFNPNGPTGRLQPRPGTTATDAVHRRSTRTTSPRSKAAPAQPSPVPLSRRAITALKEFLRAPAFPGRARLGRGADYALDWATGSAGRPPGLIAGDRTGARQRLSRRPGPSRRRRGRGASPRRGSTRTPPHITTIRRPARPLVVTAEAGVAAPLEHVAWNEDRAAAPRTVRPRRAGSRCGCRPAPRRSPSPRSRSADRGARAGCAPARAARRSSSRSGRGCGAPSSAPAR